MAPLSIKAVRRCRPLRRESDDHPWFVSSRVLEERFLLHPILTCGAKPVNREARRACKSYERHCDKRLVQVVARANRYRTPGAPVFTLEQVKQLTEHLVLSALARAQEKYGTVVYCLVVMSNHLHLVCHTRGENLAGFMGYFKARITDTINLLTGRSGPLWTRRYDAQPILDDEGVADRVGYTLNNPVAANLVRAPEQWPGLNIAYGLGDADTFECVYFDRTAWHRKKRPADLKPFFRTATLTLSPVPSCSGMSRDTYCTTLRAWVDAAHAKSQCKSADARREGLALRKAPPLGIEKVLHAQFDQRSRNPSRTKRPYAFGRTDRVRAHHRAMLCIIAGFNASADKLRAGQLDVAFPEGTYRPPLMRAA